MDPHPDPTYGFIMDLSHYDSDSPQLSGYRWHSSLQNDENYFCETHYIAPVHQQKRKMPSSQAVSSSRLPPRTKRAKHTETFAIYEDETAEEVPQRHRKFYGSSVAALPEINNGQKFHYRDYHKVRRYWVEMYRMAFNLQDHELLEYLESNHDTLETLRESVLGYYEWFTDCDPNDVWLWVRDMAYDRHWNSKQIQEFKKILRCMERGYELAWQWSREDEEKGSTIRESVTKLIENRLKKFGITNIIVEHTYKAGSLRFIPWGKDKKRLRREDFTEREQKEIDRDYGTDYWEADHSAGTLKFQESFKCFTQNGLLQQQDIVANTTPVNSNLESLDTTGSSDMSSASDQIPSLKFVPCLKFDVWDSEQSMLLTMFGDLYIGDYLVELQKVLNQMNI